MLLLSRYVGEKIFIGDNISVTVVSNKDGCVKLGFNAPTDITIDREEVRKRIEMEKAAINHLDRFSQPEMK